MTAPAAPGTISVTARVAYGTRDRLQRMKPYFEAERIRARQLAREDQWNPTGLTRHEAAALKTQWREHRVHLRELGELIDTLDALVAYGVRGELEERGWNRAWPPLPPHAPREGRWPGSREGAWPETVAVRLPAPLVLTVRAACWHTSAKAIETLRNRHDQHTPTDRGERPEKRTPAANCGSVTTGGVIWRAAIDRALAAKQALAG